MESSGTAQGALVATLRQVLKSKKITYAAVAAELCVSEQTIKRLFAGDDFPISRLVAICAFAGVSLFDLAQMADKGDEEAFFQLPIEHEQFFADHPSFLQFFNRLREGLTVEQIQSEHRLNERSVRRYLRTLAEMNLIDLLEGLRVKIKVAGGHNFTKYGPLMKRHSLDFADRLLRFLFEEKNQGEHTMWSMSDLRLSAVTLRELKTELQELATRYRKTAQREEKLLPRSDLTSAMWILALAAPYEAPFVSEPITDL